MGQALQAAQRDIDRRRSHRRSIGRATTLRDPAHQPVDVLVRNLSADGFAVDTDHFIDINDTISIGLIGIGSATARVVRRTSAGYGCAWLRPLGEEELRRAFSETTVTDGTFPSFLLRADSGSDPDDRFRRPVRGIVLAGSALACWAAIAGAVVLMA